MPTFSLFLLEILCFFTFWPLRVQSQDNPEDNPFLVEFRKRQLRILSSQLGNGPANFATNPLSGLVSSNGLGGLGGIGGGNAFGSGLGSYGGSSSPFGSGVAGVGSLRHNPNLNGFNEPVSETNPVSDPLAYYAALNGFTGGSSLVGLGPLGANLGLFPYGFRNTGGRLPGSNSGAPLSGLTYLNGHV